MARQAYILFLILVVAFVADAQHVCPYIPPADPQVLKVWDTPPLLLAQTEMSVEGQTAQQRSEQAIVQFIHRNFRWPKEARYYHVTGTAVVCMHIDERGQIDPESLRCVRDPGAGIGEASLRVAQLMVDLNLRWQAASYQGEPVAVRYCFPVRVRLE